MECSKDQSKLERDHNNKEVAINKCKEELLVKGREEEECQDEVIIKDKEIECLDQETEADKHKVDNKDNRISNNNSMHQKISNYQHKRSLNTYKSRLSYLNYQTLLELIQKKSNLRIKCKLMEQIQDAWP